MACLSVRPVSPGHNYTGTLVEQLFFESSGQNLFKNWAKRASTVTVESPLVPPRAPPPDTVRCWSTRLSCFVDVKVSVVSLWSLFCNTNFQLCESDLPYPRFNLPILKEIHTIGSDFTTSCADLVWPSMTVRSVVMADPAQNTNGARGSSKKINYFLFIYLISA